MKEEHFRATPENVGDVENDGRRTGDVLTKNRFWSEIERSEAFLCPAFKPDP